MSASRKGMSPRGNDSQSNSSSGLLQGQLVLMGGKCAAKPSSGYEAACQGLHLDGC